DADSVGRLVQLLPDVCVGLISKEATTAVLDRAAELGAGRVLVRLAAATAEFVRTAHERGFRVDVWPVDTSDQVRQAVELDADGFTTDDPRLVVEAGYRVTDEGLVPVG
ncbi:MAG TPA: glycerophosphodiester phosphodiesterase family protein, partial [Ruania sp.]|nr:glycerophosphodiester phosphodiesterase family protein [Ruania sp.]